MQKGGVLMMPVLLPTGAAGATGAIFLELDDGLVIAGGRFVWIADTNRIDRFDRSRRRGCRAHRRRWMRGPQRTMYSGTGRRRCLLLFCSDARSAILIV